MPLADLRALARRIADAGVAVTVLPATELFMMGRDQEYGVRRGVADVNLLVEHGVNCSLSTNNVLNPFTPYRRCVAAADGESAGQRVPDQRAGAAARVLRHADRAVGTADEPADYGIEVGNPADIVVLDAATPEQAVAEICHPLAVFKRGRRTVTRPRAELHRPA